VSGERCSCGSDFTAAADPKEGGDPVGPGGQDGKKTDEVAEGVAGGAGPNEKEEGEADVAGAGAGGPKRDVGGVVEGPKEKEVVDEAVVGPKENETGAAVDGPKVKEG